MARLARDHTWNHRARTKHDTIYVDAHDSLVGIIVDFFERIIRDVANYVLMRRDTSVKTDNVKRLECWQQFVPCLRVSYVEMNIFAANFDCNLFAERVVDIGNDDCCPFASEPARHLGTDAARTAGNKCSLPY